jgi:dolichyl-phosphooligosaccharide-protein glycotransferase
MRKRAQQSTQTTTTQTTTKTVATESPAAPKSHRFSIRSVKARKNFWVGVTLIAIFFLVLFFNTYFNLTSNANINSQGTDLTSKFYLSGPDPYYNMRLVENTSQTGTFPYYYVNDPLLNYPIGQTGGRGPLMVMSAIAFSKVLTPFMSPSDALGFAMQFIPALFGALLVFPVYLIGRIIFGRKEGIIAALLIAIIPIEVSSGHGSAFALFDHDSFNLLMYFMTFLFFLISFKEKDRIKSILYAVLAGVPLAALTMVWTEAEFLYAVLAVYIVVQLIIDVILNKTSVQFVRSSAIMMFTGFFVSLPVIIHTPTPISLPFFLALGVTLFGAACLFFRWRKVPWIVSIPVVAIVAGAAAGLLYIVWAFPNMLPNVLEPLSRIANIVYGTGIYGNKVSLTIAEAGTYNISRTVMSYGPAVYWLAWLGFVFVLYRYATHRDRRDYMFIIVLFLVQLWLTSTAGRFLNDMVPIIALLSGLIIWFVIAKIDYKKMIKNIQNAGGGFRGLRRGVKLTHIIGVLFVVFIVLVPNTFLALDAAVPSAITKNGTSNLKADVFGSNFSGAFGGSSYKEQYWVAAYDWLRTQDANVSPAQRPAYISWWDYGFYEVAVGKHPTVADNFQDGIPAAANFQTALGEKQGVAVWTIRLLLANAEKNGGQVTPAVRQALYKSLNASGNNTNASKNNTANKLIGWVENPKSAPSYLAPIGAQYDKNVSKEVLVGSQWPENAVYLDGVQLLNASLNDDQMTWLYHNIQNATGKSIRYYGVEGYDEQIFNIFAFLADKSNSLIALRTSGKTIANPEDDFMQIRYTGYQLNADNTPGQEQTWSAQEINNMTAAQRNKIQISSTTTVYKQAYFDTMFYQTYIGLPPSQDSSGNLQASSQQLPTYAMKHFAAEYVSPYPYYGGGKSAVVIAKYYEGAFLNGTVKSVNGSPMPYVHVIVLDNYGFPHDNVYTDANGTFSLISPGGNVTLLLTYPGDELLLHKVRLNETNNSLYAPITDQQAMRIPGANYTRQFSFAINNSNLTGYVYNDVNGNKSYDPGVDQPVPGATVYLADLFFARNIPNATTDSNGQYHFANIPPSKYNVSAIQDGFTLNTTEVNVEPGLFWHNISKPKLAGVKGLIYKDANNNGKPDVGEAQPGVNVSLRYTALSGKQTIVRQMTTDSTGNYQFASLVPGQYAINASMRGTASNLLYANEVPVKLNANVTAVQNISLVYAKVAVSGKATLNGTGLGNIPIQFTPNGLVKNNTAVTGSATADKNGTYIARLAPGSYNVTINKQMGSTSVYKFSGQIVIAPGQNPITYDIAVSKVSTTVTGMASYNGIPYANVTVSFKPDGSHNNTAILATAKTNTTGQYTVELAPGNYNITATGTTKVNGTNQTITSTTTQHLTILAGQAKTVINVVMTRVQ